MICCARRAHARAGWIPPECCSFPACCGERLNTICCAAGTRPLALIDAPGMLRWEGLSAAYDDGTMDELIGWALERCHAASQPYVFAASHSDDLRRLRLLHQ